MTDGNLEELITGIGKPRVLVVGDLMLDRYIWGDVGRISPEAPVPVLKVEREENKLGGSGSVIANLVCLGAQTSCCGVIGDDYHGGLVLAELEKLGVAAKGIFAVPGRPTGVKTRVIARVQHVVRVDNEDTSPFSLDIEDKVVRFIADAVPEQDLVIISDYNKGLLSERVARETVAAARKHKKPVLVDSKSGQAARFSGSTTITPNRREAEQLTGLVLDSEENIRRAAQKLMQDLDLAFATITLDREGIAILSRDSFQIFPTHPVEVYDTTGAGDMALSVMGFVMAGGCVVEDAVRLANIACGIEISRVGVSPITRQEIVARIRGMQYLAPGKIKTQAEIVQVVAEARRKNKRIVFTNGCFDLLHIGHITYLQFAKAQGDILIVAVNTDESVRRLKGPSRPILDQTHRGQILSAIQWIDYIIFFGEDTPLELIKLVRPDILIKGAQYNKEEVVGADFVESYGGEVRLAPMVNGISTTDIVHRIRELYRDTSS
jgi:D-beta-D-heptose 7-phosphate kinase/D-beta-D-heptose 1-phosphate adenosyltransferase